MSGMAADAPGAPRLFYGWIVVAAAFAVMFVAFGAAYTFPGFFDALRDEFGASRGMVSLVFSLAGFLYFALGAVSGGMADRFGPAPVVGFGIACIALGMAAAGLATSMTGVIVAYGLGIGIGVGFAYVPAISTVQRWFLRRRGQASGLAVMGIGIGTMVTPPVAAMAIDQFGWRGAYFLLGGCVAVLGIIAALALRSSPAAMGLHPDGEAPPAAASAPPPGMTLAEVLRDRGFWLLYVACAINCIGTFVPFVHLAAYAQDQGLSRTEGVWLVGLIGLGSTLGRFILGSAADRMGRDKAFAATMAFSGLALLYWMSVTTFWPLAAFAVAFGIFYGGFVALAPAMIVDLFGLKAAGSIIGVLYTSVAASTLLGPTLAGVAFDRFGSYSVPIGICAAACFIGAAGVLLLPRVSHR